MNKTFTIHRQARLKKHWKESINKLISKFCKLFRQVATQKLIIFLNTNTQTKKKKVKNQNSMKKIPKS